MLTFGEHGVVLTEKLKRRLLQGQIDTWLRRVILRYGFRPLQHDFDTLRKFRIFISEAMRRNCSLIV